MPINRNKIRNLINFLTASVSIDQIAERLKPKQQAGKPRIRPTKKINRKSVNNYWEFLKQHTDLSLQDQQVVADACSLNYIDLLSNNIENCIGTVKLPLGVAGPLRVNGLFAQGDYYLPLATTEAALVASYNRGAQLITQAGGCTSAILNDGITRSPGFIFKNLIEVSQFIIWMHDQFDALREVAESTTNHGKLVDVRTTVEGNHVYVNFDYYTEDASGQNIATIATAAALQYIKENTPIEPQQAFVEANFSGDKKASALSYLSVRGKKVTAEVILDADLVKKVLNTTAATLADYWRIAALGGVMTGTMGVQGHFANGLAALYLATGQDAACVSESSVGITRLELTDNGSLYASVTLPNIVVGTVGGGTSLPSQNIGLKLMGLQGEGHVHALAEVCAACCLAGELSIMGAICAGDFASAHQRLARKRKANT